MLNIYLNNIEMLYVPAEWHGLLLESWVILTSIFEISEFTIETGAFFLNANTLVFHVFPNESAFNHLSFFSSLYLYCISLKVIDYNY